MTTLLVHIKELLQIREKGELKISGADMKELPTLKNAYLLIQNDLITDYGEMAALPRIQADHRIDCTGKIVLPAWCDSHTHLVYAGSREQEFVDRINGLTYEAIAKRGGGILNSARKLRETPEEQLFEEASERLEEMMRMGTGAMEIKSGYGLTTAAELKMLRVIRKIKERYPLPIKATFLGAHALPQEYKGDTKAYLDVVIKDMLPKVAGEKLAEFIDIFCETGYFSVADTERLLQAGEKYGLRPKIHVNQFTAIGGVQAGVKYNALSVDHLEEMREEDISALQHTDTMPVALPGCSYFLGIPYTPARKMIDAGLPLALATDYNPGSAPSGNMNFVVSTACIKMSMTPEEAINAATLNGAYAMGIADRYGSITKGKKANLMITATLPSYACLPYAFGHHRIEKVMIDGRFI